MVEEFKANAVESNDDVFDKISGANNRERPLDDEVIS